MKRIVKTLDDYAYDLFLVASQDIIQEFLTYMAEGNRVQAIKILRKYHLFE